MNRRNNVRFNPKATIDILSQGEPPEDLDEEQRRELVQKYIEVQLISLLDDTKTNKIRYSMIFINLL